MLLLQYLLGAETKKNMYPGKYISRVRIPETGRSKRRSLIIMASLILILLMIMLYSRDMSAIQIKAEIALSSARLICDGKEISHTGRKYDKKTWRVFVKKGRGACMLKRETCKPLTFRYNTESGPEIVPVELHCENIAHE